MKDKKQCELCNDGTIAIGDFFVGYDYEAIREYLCKDHLNYVEKEFTVMEREFFNKFQCIECGDYFKLESVMIRHWKKCGLGRGNYRKRVTLDNTNY